jgi:fructoselysine 6-phosphate deglycase
MPKTKKSFQPITFDHSAFLKAFDGALSELDAATILGTEAGMQGFRHIFFTGCGAPHYMMRVLAYWAKKASESLDIRNYFSAELIHQNPAALDADTLVLLGSHSGKTKETVQAAQYLREKACRTVGITQQLNSPLGKSCDDVIAYGETKEGYFSSYLLGQIFVSALLSKLEKDWDLHADLSTSLPNLPTALADAKSANLTRAAEQAKIFADDRIIYVIGAGPMFTTAYTFASCFLMEMQRMHAHPLEAAEFFHGPFEVVDKSTPIIILLGESPSRPEAERVVHFCQQHAKRFVVMDSKDFSMKNILPSIRALIAPFVLDVALTALVENLAVVHDFPLTTRRYMGKVDY